MFFQMDRRLVLWTGKGSQDPQFTSREIKRRRSIVNDIIEFHETTKPIIRGLIFGKTIDFESNEGCPLDWGKMVKEIEEATESIDTEGYMETQFDRIRNPKIIGWFTNVKEVYQKSIREHQNDIIKDSIIELNKEEKKEINRNIKERIISNFTGEEMPEKLIQLLKNGRKFVPNGLEGAEAKEELFKEELTRILNKIVHGHEKDKINAKTIERDLRRALSNPRIQFEDVQLLEAILEDIEENKKEAGKAEIGEENNIETTEYQKYFNKLAQKEGKVILESDKGLGFSLLFIHQVLKLYDNINKIQNLVKIDLDDDGYLEWLTELKKQHCPEIPKQIMNMLDKDKIINFKETKGKIAGLRLLIKSGKIPDPSLHSFKDLTARTIKAGTKDPINGISDVLRVIMQNIIRRLKGYMNERFGKVFTVVGSDDAYKKTSDTEKQGSITETINFQMDVFEMYPNCLFPIVQNAVLIASRILKIEGEVVRFMVGGIFVIMKCNVVTEPTGTYLMGDNDPDKMGLSIGDRVAAEISDMTVIVYEVDMASVLEQEKLSQHLKLYLRFRDDVDARVGGTMEEKMRILWIILTSFPRCFRLKASASHLVSKFLDIKRIARLGHKENLAVLRKNNNAYDITRSHSNTFLAAKRAAMYCYAYRMVRKTNWVLDRKHQLDINLMVLRARGYKDHIFKGILQNARGHVKRKEAKIAEGAIDGRRYLPPVTFDKVSRNHCKIIKFIDRLGTFKRYKKPGYRTKTKVLGLVYTKKIFLKRISRYLETKINRKE